MIIDSALSEIFLEFHKLFRLTDLRVDRKVKLTTVMRYMSIPDSIYDLFRIYFKNDTFILFIWEKWFKKWSTGNIKPFFTYDPLVDEKEIKYVPLYREGKLVTIIPYKKFMDYPIITLSPEWWEGDTAGKMISISRKGKGSSGKFIAFPYIEGMYITRCYDPRFWGGCDNMEIYVYTMERYTPGRDRVDFPEVDQPQRWYPSDCSFSSCYWPYGFDRRTYFHINYTHDYLFQVWEDDGGLRGGDDLVGGYVEEDRAGGRYYISCGDCRMWVYIGNCPVRREN